MSSFVYFVPGVNNNEVDWKSLGLSYALGNDCVRGNNQEGMDGVGGAVLSDSSQPGHLNRIVKDKQVWKKCGKYWIGYWKDDPPTAATLKRKTQLYGKPVRMQGQEWEVPCAISFDETNGELLSTHHLSRYVSFDDEGEPTYGEVEEQFAPLMDIAMKWMGSNEEGGWTLIELWKAAGRVMSFNYRAGFHELCLLNVLTDRTAKEIMDVCVDISGVSAITDAVEDRQKKSSESGGLITSDGETAGAEPTSPLQLIL